MKKAISIQQKQSGPPGRRRRGNSGRSTKAQAKAASHSPRSKPSSPKGSMVFPRDAEKRVWVEHVYPEVDEGQWQAKSTLGDRFVVEADLVCDGHEAVVGVLLYRSASSAEWEEIPLEFVNNDRFRAGFVPTHLGLWEYTIEAWVDEFTTWQRALCKKVEAGQDVRVELLIGADIVSQAARRASKKDRKELQAFLKTLRSAQTKIETRINTAFDVRFTELMAANPDRKWVTRYERVLEVHVDRLKARFSAWYELFPRSTGPAAGKHGTFRDVEAILPYVASMGFDVLYLPPVHPIGVSYRKGKNNALVTEDSDPGSPWAIGSDKGGHKAVHPKLGTLADFRRLVAKAKEYDLEIALDIAFQASADHPYVKKHPEWFKHRPDGTIQYAENPPKKYQDIYPFDFGSKDWKALWRELRGVFVFWIEQGVRLFRVDNPHTKPLKFWAWCLRDIQQRYPDVLFLSEAFTRPKLMNALAKVGFSQSYTYFTWRHTGRELRDYLLELTTSEVKAFFRPNFWPNTPDILPEHLQFGGRPAFIARLVLSATLSSNYGIYGPAFELMEHVARPGSEEYIDNEKYEIRDWNLDDPDSLRPVITRINRARHEHRALQSNTNLCFHPTDNDQLLCFSKHTDDFESRILVVVNLDYYHTQSGWVNLDLASLGMDRHNGLQVHDLLSDARYLWYGPRNYVELNPHALPAHVFAIRRFIRREQDFDYYT